MAQSRSDNWKKKKTQANIKLCTYWDKTTSKPETSKLNVRKQMSHIINCKPQSFKSTD